MPYLNSLTIENVPLNNNTETTTEVQEPSEVVPVFEKIDSKIDICIFTFSLIIGLLIASLFAKGFNSNAK